MFPPRFGCFVDVPGFELCFADLPVLQETEASAKPAPPSPPASISRRLLRLLTIVSLPLRCSVMPASPSCPDSRRCCRPRGRSCRCSGSRPLDGAGRTDEWRPRRLEGSEVGPFLDEVLRLGFDLEYLQRHVA